MVHQKIDYVLTDSFSKTVIDYLNQEKHLEQFYSYSPNIEAVKQVIEKIKSFDGIDRGILSETLNQQYKSFVPNLNVVKNISLLKDENTFTITTAHQLNLFTGPLYYIFKILNTIRVCRDLQKQYPTFNFVPCYWMGSEDHDFDEINHTYLFSKKIEWNNFQGGSVGEHHTDGIEPLIDELKEIIRQGPFLQELIGLFKRSYAEKNLANAVRKLLDELFGKYGLVVIDGNCNELKKPFQKIIKDELLNETSSKFVEEQIQLLENNGYKAQAFPRAINLFYKTNNSRERIIANEDGFELSYSGEKFTQDELLKILKEFPDRFSPNVILRPLHQQFTLPNIAYIGGGSEIAYWMQLKTLHHHYNTHFPMLLLRTSAQIISKSQQKKMEKLDIDAKSIFKDVETLKKEFIANQTELDLNLVNEEEFLNSFYEKLSIKAEAIDPSLKAWVSAEGQKTLKSLGNISKRLIKSEKSRNDQSMAQIEKLKELLFPNGSLQERRENFSPFYANYGAEFFDSLLEILNPFEKKFYLIEG